MLKLIVFDCDGVMFSSLEANRVYYNHLLKQFGYPPMNAEELSYAHTQSVRRSVEYIFRNHPVELDEVNAYRDQLDYAPFLQHMQMEPDLVPFLEWAKPRFNTAISTNRTNTMDMVLDTFAIRPWFDMVVTATDAGRPKPAPDALLMILDRFKVKPEETIFIGDSVVDRDHCVPLGVDLIAFKNPELEAKYHVESFMEIKELPPLQKKA